MAPNLSKYLSRTSFYKGAGSIAILIAIYKLIVHKRTKQLNKNIRAITSNIPKEEIQYLISDKKDGHRIKAQVDGKFFQQLNQILKILVPGWVSSEAGLFLMVACSLIARSLCDLWMINNGTKIESAIIAMNKRLFRRRLLNFMAMMPLISLVNNILKYSIGDLKIRLRTNLTHRMYDDYLKHYTYYRMCNLDNRIANADQLLTTDVEKFAASLTDLYCNTAKPLLDIGIYVYLLQSTMGGGTPSLMLAYMLLSGAFLTRLRRPTARLTAEEQRLEGEFRHINARLITHSEEVAFYNGNQREKLTLLTSYAKVVRHLRKVLHFQLVMGIVDNVVAKYFASVVGFCAVSLPFLAGQHSLATTSQGERSRLYYTYGRMMVKLAEAVGRLVLAGRELTRLAGYTARVTQFRRVLDDLNAGTYQRTMIEQPSATAVTANSGRIIYRNHVIRFEQVPLVTPNGDVLIQALSIEITAGMNVLVCGPNGSGKSSLFRVLGELWPMFGGQLTKPPRGKLFYIPQRPYMTLGTLRDQLTYPHANAEAKRRGATDDILLEYLQHVQLEYLVEREGGLSAIADWLDVLSGGEKQRIAMVRVFYHRPQFAILDECTSAVSVDVEASMYRYCRQAGITLFTVSHRKSLWQHHEYVLYLDGRGAYTFQPISETTEQFGS